MMMMKRILILLLVLGLTPGVLLLAGGKTEQPAAPEAKIEELKVEVVKEGEKAGALGNYKIYPTPADYTKATGKQLPAYKQAPVLDELVRAGKLQPVAQRLPAEPCVVQPTARVGKYGGTLTGIRPSEESYAGSPQHLSLIVPTGEYIMTLAKGWEIGPDYKSLTIHLRKGARWSDGAPFTADDMLFWYNDIMLNQDLTPSLPAKYVCGGEPYKLEKLDDYTVRFRSKEPYYGIKTVIFKRSLTSWVEYAPKHYLSRYHLKFNPDAEKVAKAEGFENWKVAFNAKMAPILYGADMMRANPELPTMSPWFIKESTPEKLVMERNPYFWAVDVEGNQLPYIDREVEFVAENEEAMNLRVLNGDVDFRLILWWNAPAIIAGEARGKYVLMKTYMGNELAWTNICFNLSNQDTVMGPILRDVRFRRALSVAINRQELLDGPWMGVGRICQSTVRDTDPLFEPQWLGNHAQFDTALANRLLDEMGLKWDNKKEFRLRPDGKRLQMIIDTMDWDYAPTEPIADHWKAVGVDTIVKSSEWSLYLSREESNEFHCTAWTSWSQDHEMELSMGGYDPNEVGYRWGGPWATWWGSGGKQGLEPPANIKPYFETRARFLSARSEEEYLKYGKAMWQWLADNLPVIGTVGYNPFPAVVSNRLKNAWPFNVGCFEQEGQKLQWYLEQ